MSNKIVMEPRSDQLIFSRLGNRGRCLYAVYTSLPPGPLRAVAAKIMGCGPSGFRSRDIEFRRVPKDLQAAVKNYGVREP